MFAIAMAVSLVFLSVSILVGLYRIIIGPSMPDRVIALDAIGINLIAMVAVLSVTFRTSAYLEIILLMGIIAFIGTVAFSKYIERGIIIESRRGD
ncbi:MULTISPECIES: Na(+)/H(+) antiporter subunit F1 [Sinobaca]|uniref:Multicomponent Na+:H+ antiporter subunit F n=1 Tax=Sinobaca qinghaiensis TaxID=342944 RepID=A0A419V4T9_9BACL|nr:MULTISPECIES: Na(+)/H(+) antiporter subunit F1 [Sinobaca]RKD73451.1 multicomponent Na+:H+ antiporter subunit F [Sinobaca qinghaiensis]